MLKEHLNKQRSYRYEERYLDLGVVLKPKIALYGAYSLIYNAWFMPPDRFLTSKLKADDIVRYRNNIWRVVDKQFDFDIKENEFSSDSHGETVILLRR